VSGKLQTRVVHDKKLDRDLKFKVRPSTSDDKALKEVVEKAGYGRYGFAPQEGEYWYDLGGNIGAFSVWAAARGASVTCYEPDPTMAQMIVDNVKLNKLTRQVNVECAAVVAKAPRSGKLTLHLNSARGNLWRSSVEREWQGGESVEVDAVGISTIWDSGSYWKMDVEGSEMAILETLLAKRAKPAAGLVFEWSFDVDRSIPRFVAVRDGLRERYDIVNHGKIAEDAPEWLPSWFPPARLVWCGPEGRLKRAVSRG
jgi:FkbM family methyltransferase